MDTQGLGELQVFAVKEEPENADPAETASLSASGGVAACQEGHAAGGERVHVCHKTKDTDHGAEFVASRGCIAMPTTYASNICTPAQAAGYEDQSTRVDMITDQATDCCTQVRLHPTTGRHSRSRKDLVNLNKAVTRWLQHVVEGELLLTQVTQRIKESKVAQTLASAQGIHYDENRFVASVLDAARSKPRNAA
jgi:hypothetical protein